MKFMIKLSFKSIIEHKIQWCVKTLSIIYKI